MGMFGTQALRALAAMVMIVPGTAGAQTASLPVVPPPPPHPTPVPPPPPAPPPPIVTTPVAAADDKNAGSAYLKCDGNPNNYTTGEAAARLLGAMTLLAVFAPDREGTDFTKRLRGDAGVAACTSLIEGEHKEGNPERRVGLILGRALHRIEAKRYDAALADIDLAEREASAAGFTRDAYWMRSRGRSFGLIRSAALFRLGRVAEARDAALATTVGAETSVLSMISTPDYGDFIKDRSPAALAHDAALAKLYPILITISARHLDEIGRFADAARADDAMIAFARAGNPEKQSSNLLMLAANDHMLAGDRAGGVALAAQARDNAAKRRADGQPESGEGELIEAQDLNAILVMMADGDVKGARRLFAARSQWINIPFGQSQEVNRRLRAGAAPDDLIGGLAKTPDQLWQDRADARRAALLAKDDDNSALWGLMRTAVPARAFEAASAKVWKVEGSKLILKPSDKRPAGVAYDLLFLPGVDRRALPEIYMLHAALLARSRGHQGFTILPIEQGGLFAARVVTGQRGTPGLPDLLFNDAADVIARLQPLIPDPATLKARRPG